MPRKYRLLIVDNHLPSHERWKIEMGDRFLIESVLTLEDAQVAITEQPEFALIAVESFEGEAIPFVKRLRRTYRKPIIGVAASYPIQLKLIQAGCTAFAERFNLPERVYETFGLL